MNTVDTRIERYLLGVREALADLPDEARDELLEDLPDHLAEVLDEQGGSLEEQLGPPAVYAAELRSAAGLDVVRSDSLVGTMRENLASAGVEALRWLRVADNKVGPWIGYQQVTDFLRLLRPAWWVVRGWVVAALLFLLGPFPQDQLDDVFGWLVVLTCVALSIRLGPVLHRLPDWARGVAVVSTALAAVFVVANVHVGQGGGGYYEQSGYDSRWDQVRNVFPYDKDGKPLDGVTLFDQDGNPLRFGDYYRCTDSSGGSVPSYPLCNGPGRYAPPRSSVPSDASPSDASPSVRPSVRPSVSPSGSSSPSPAASTTPSGSPSPSE